MTKFNLVEVAALMAVAVRYLPRHLDLHVNTRRLRLTLRMRTD